MKFSLSQALTTCLIILFIISLNACALSNRIETLGSWLNKSSTNPSELSATPLPPLPQTIIEFHLQVPPNTPTEDTIYLSILDEVTGLVLNAQRFPMQKVSLAEDSSGYGPQQYVLTLPLAIGSVIKYRYERETQEIRVSEHLADGSPVRYRMYYVQGQGRVDDIVSRWTDTPFILPIGRIIGQVTDADTLKPIPNLLVAAGGAQTVTTLDGYFRIDGLPPGVHNLVVYSMDGTYRTFQQGARVAAQSTTPAPITVHQSPMVKLIFVVSVPPDTPPVVPLRLAGNLTQLGNSFSTLNGGISSIAANMPVLAPLPDGRYSITLSLPAGSDVRYKYTLGDGFWNAEHTQEGAFRLRQVVVPEFNTLIEDQVETWYAGNANSITFDVTVPANTPKEDFVAMQIAPLFGWTEPIPMWRLGENRWAYILYSPLNLPGNFSYRYCRNGLCGVADDVKTPGVYGAGRPMVIQDEPQTYRDTVDRWTDLPYETPQAFDPQPSIEVREPEFWKGVEWLPMFHPAWTPTLQKTILILPNMSANTLVLAPTWTFGHYYPGNTIPLFEPIPGKDMRWEEITTLLHTGQSQGLQVVLFPQANFWMDSDEWWATASRQADWWINWFEQYRNFALYHAELAAQNNLPAIILGGAWLKPALPQGALADGTPSGVPAHVLDWWQSLIQEMRARFTGKIGWALSSGELQHPPQFINLVDFVYVLLSVESSPRTSDQIRPSEISYWMDAVLLPSQQSWGKPIVLGLSAASSPDYQSQAEAYGAALSACSQREWIHGFVSRGFYPLSQSLNIPDSIFGKPAMSYLSHWLSLLNPIHP